MQSDRPAIALVGFGRPDYIGQVAKSIASQCEGYDVHVFLDGGPGAMQSENVAAVKNAGLGSATFHLQKVNLGCGNHLIHVRETLLDRESYPAALICEDDFVLYPGYVKYTERLLEWGRANNMNVGVTQGWHHTFLGDREKISKYVTEPVTYTSLLGYLITREAWQAIRADMRAIQRAAFTGTPYAKRRKDPLVNYLNSALKGRKSTVLDTRGILSPTVRQQQWTSAVSSWIPEGQDGATSTMLLAHGFCRLSPLTNFGEYVGRSGIHMKPHRWDEVGFSMVDWRPVAMPSTLEMYSPRLYKNSTAAFSINTRNELKLDNELRQFEKSLCGYYVSRFNQRLRIRLSPNAVSTPHFVPGDNALLRWMAVPGKTVVFESSRLLTLLLKKDGVGLTGKYIRSGKQAGAAITLRKFR